MGFIKTLLLKSELDTWKFKHTDLMAHMLQSQRTNKSIWANPYLTEWGLNIWSIGREHVQHKYQHKSILKKIPSFQAVRFAGNHK